ncbi:MAG: Nif3-like dinuclear metal center hexameric protein [Verrucomicrobia bacterium]|nr:Nif3-like dinuclear metal center hexameric protein [Verrucomicrobiota bacterium]MDA1006548.1 Nif3-like dinuclear metal center hexameric protein [Verrucomicrobiota bacterium]
MADLLSDIVSYLDTELRVAEVPDYPGAVNGLQLASSGKVTRVAAAVDATLPVVTKAVEAGADLLVVHHGMFWNGVNPVTGAHFKKLKTAMEGGLAIYSAHIPLDVHPLLGNNVLLAEAVGVTDLRPFFTWKGIELGLKGEWEGDLASLIAAVEGVLGSGVHVRGEPGDAAGKVGIITGGAGSEVKAVAAAGVDTFLTGEGPHWSFTSAEELDLKVIYGGHYATETFGVRALAERLGQEFGLPWSFLDHPSGL